MASVIICLTVDWEGEHFKNLHDLGKIRELIGEDIPVSHFICPAYYFRKQKRVTEKIKTVVKKNDEIHLHIHCYKELVEAAGMMFRTEENYYKNKWFSPKKPSGRGVPLTVYKANEQEQIIRFSLEKLKAAFPDHPISGFRAGGNIINDDTLGALHNLGFQFDSSATSPEIYSKGFTTDYAGSGRDDYGHDLKIFKDHIIKLWGGQPQKESFLQNHMYMNSSGDKPQKLTSQPFRMGHLFELPENCGTSDFVSPAKSTLPVLNKLIATANKSGKIQYLNYGCHNEGPAYYKMQFLDFVRQIQKDSDTLQFGSLTQALRIFSEA